VIGEAQTGTGFGGLARYLATGKRGDNPDRVEWAEARNLPTTDVNTYPAMMRSTARLSRRVQDPVFHFSISWPVNEKLEREAMVSIADRALSDLELSEYQSVIVCHNDTKHPHLHVMVNRVHPETGKAWAKWRYKTRLEKSLKAQERELGLQQVPGRLTRKMGCGERMKQRAEGGFDVNALVQWGKDKIMSLRQFIRPHFDEAGSWSDLEDRISEEGLGIHAKGQGLIFSDGEAYAKLSQLGGKKHRLALLEARFGDWKSYQKERHETSGGFTRNDGLTKDEHSEIEKRLAAHKKRRAKARDRDDGFER
jgi:MobA/VirD2-like, nuclease domain